MKSIRIEKNYVNHVMKYKKVKMRNEKKPFKNESTCGSFHHILASYIVQSRVVIMFLAFSHYN